MRADVEDDFTEYVKARLPRLRQAASLLCGVVHRADDSVVGYTNPNDGGTIVAARWNLHTGKVDVLPRVDEARVVDAQGNFVGSVENPYLVRDGTAKPLPGAPGATSTYPVVGAGEARGISADGRTVLGNVNTPRTMLSVVWHC